MRARRLTISDADAFKNLRLYALKTEGRYFSASLEQEASYSAAQWAELCRETPEKCVFGLFDGKRLVGFMMARRQDENTAYWGSAYIHPDYRGRGPGRSLYALREEWTRERGFTRAVFNFFDHCSRSRAIHVSRGARYTHTQGNLHWYEVDIPPVPERPAVCRETAREAIPAWP